MLWAACTLAFFGFFRSGETSDQAFDPTVHLTTDNVLVDSLNSPSTLCVRLKQSEIDTFRIGVNVWIGKTDIVLCPVAAVLSFLSMYSTGEGPLFIFFQDGRAVTRNRLVKELRQSLQEMGINPSAYSGHSFRIGATTAAHAAGMEDSTIRMLGRWESDAVMMDSSGKSGSADTATKYLDMHKRVASIVCYTMRRYTCVSYQMLLGVVWFVACVCSQYFVLKWMGDRKYIFPSEIWAIQDIS